MRHLFAILAALLLCSVPLHAQTLKSLMYNTTNGQVVANTGTNVLRFDNLLINGTEYSNGEIARGAVAIDFEDQQIVGSWEFTSAISFQDSNAFATTRANLGFSTNLNSFWTATNSATARTNLSIGLPALTNTSNVTMMRALSGSTNTNEPYSGTVSLTNTNAVLTFSNGILQSVQ